MAVSSGRFGDSPVFTAGDPLAGNGDAQSTSFSLTEDVAGFTAILAEPLRRAEEIGDADIVVGIPFVNESDTIGHVIEVVTEGLKQFYPSSKAVIVAVGNPAGKEALDVVNSLPADDGIPRIAFLLESERAGGKGWGVWAIMAVARALGADLAIFEADLRKRERDGLIEGLVSEWIGLLLDPIRRGELDLVASRFVRHYLEAPISSHVVFPIMAAVYDCPLHDLTGGLWGISRRLVRTFLQKHPVPPSVEVGGYGIDTWLATTAVISRARIGEAALGIKVHRPSMAKADMVLAQAVRVLFDQAAAYREHRDVFQNGTEPVVHLLPSIGVGRMVVPDTVTVVPEQLVDRFKRSFATFRALYQWVLPGEVYAEMAALSEREVESFRFPHGLWAVLIYHLLLAAAFTSEYAEGDLIGALVTAYHGHVAGFALEAAALRGRLSSLDTEEADRLVSLESERQVGLMMDEFLRLKPEFLNAWRTSAEALRPPVPNVTYREFVPGAPLIVPSELSAPDGSTVTANAVYESVLRRKKEEFESFVHGTLGVPTEAGSEEIGRRIREFLLHVESELAETVLTGDLTTVAGTRNVVDVIFRFFRRRDSLALVPEMAAFLLWRYPPTNLITRLGYGYLNEMMNDYDANDILALASWTEEHDYKEQVGELIKGSVRPEHLVQRPLKPLVVDLDEFPSLAEMKESPSLSRIAGRLVLANLRKGMGGEFPRLRYLTTVAKQVVEAERFGEIWQRYAGERKEFAEKVINALEGHWGKTPLSAHSIFENGHHRVLVERLREMDAELLAESPDDSVLASLAGHLGDVADSYHLGLMLRGGVFVPCSAWTWASYSFKGGTGLPTPLSLHVERDWASRDFLTAYYTATGGDEARIEEAIADLMAEGREFEDLAPILLGAIHEAEKVVSPVISAEDQPPAGPLVRFEDNPVLEPIAGSTWESKYLFNPGAIRLNGKVYLVYRAIGHDDDVSRLGLAVSSDGFSFDERLPEPIFEPAVASEEKGCEDPRLTLVDDRVHMVYTAYSISVAQIAVASISVDDFVNYRWKNWHRHGLAFPSLSDKDGALFPAVFDGKFAMIHRVDPHIWITFSPHMRCPWPRREHQILAGSRSGLVWDSRKIGGGSQPLKTEFGWLMIYHGVDHNHVYRLGVMLLAETDPTVLLYRSPNFVLEPSEAFEVGNDDSWVPNVVFTCGAVAREGGKEVLGADDEILVYYGAADTVIGVATARVGDLIPKELR